MKLGQSGRTVRMGFIGYGRRGQGELALLVTMPDVEVTAVCDIDIERAKAAQKAVEEKRGTVPFATSDYHELLAREDVEAVVIMTGWTLHVPIAVAAMRAGKIPAMEVGGATSLEECWELVHVSEETGIHVMMLENCCYNDVEMALFNMVRKGVFGELVHCRGGYQHDLRTGNGNADKDNHHRLQHFMNRNAELYPTHELGPISMYLGLNRGNRMVTLTSMASKAIGQKRWIQKNRPDAAYANADIKEGDVVTTMISCANGETIMLTHDCTLPRPYSRGGLVQGDRGLWMEDGHGIYLESDEPEDLGDRLYSADHHAFEPDKPYLEKYEHPLWKEYRDFGLRGGHGGMDYLVFRAFIESIQKGVDFPINVYDAATWMAITCLSEQSIAMGSAPVLIPDFTRGGWMHKETRPADKYSLDDVYPDMYE